MMKRLIAICLIIIVFRNFVTADESHVRFVPPVRFPMLLAGNFGEPRYNHFHQGIDVKTLHSVNKTICSVAEGYVSRITIGVGGFGKALYITHPNGVTSLYCHLNEFSSPIRQYIKIHQQGHPITLVDIKVPVGELMVAAGQPVALSGNTGSSEGPHLHMEFHRVKNDNLIDPLPFFRQYIRDTVAPVAHGIIIIPMKMRGAVDGLQGQKFFGFNGKHLSSRICAWGDVGIAIWANDYASDTYNRLGVHSMKMLVDGKEFFSSQIDEFSPIETRCVNSWSVYEHFYRSGHPYLRSYIEPGNVLRLLHSNRNRGVLTVNEERDYHVEFILSDVYGNQSSYSFVLHGSPTEIPHREKRPVLLRCEQMNVAQSSGMQIVLPRGVLYNDVYEPLCESVTRGQFSRSYKLRNIGVPLGGWATMTIKPFPEALKWKEKLYVEMHKGAICKYLESQFNGISVSARIRELDASYTIAIDTVKPVVTPLSPLFWRVSKRILCRAIDRQTAIKSVIAKVDEQSVPVSFDRYRGLVECSIDPTVIRKSNKHMFRLTVSDVCGNTQTIEQLF